MKKWCKHKLPFRDASKGGGVKDLPNRLLIAARANAIPSGLSGLWRVKKVNIPHPIFAHCGDLLDRDKGATIPAGRYTALHRMTAATMHTDGELVMHDVPHELKSHLNFMLRARGGVLITGLGLGCVVRGVLANPAVHHVTVVERDADVLRLVEPFMPKSKRLTIIPDDALEYAKTTRERFDYAWHDLWVDPDYEEKHLQVIHGELMCALFGKADWQGAWRFPRELQRLLRGE